VIRAGLISLALLAATLAPLARDPLDDGFPLSTYPMFAFPRATVQTFDYVIGETAAGDRRAIAPELVGSHEVLQARAVIESAVGGGPDALLALCRAIARRARYPLSAPERRPDTSQRCVNRNSAVRGIPARMAVAAKSPHR